MKQTNVIILLTVAFLSIFSVSAQEGHFGAHSVPIAIPSVTADADGNGFESIHLEGTGSHCHGCLVDSLEWRIDGLLVSSAFSFDTALAVGSHNVSLKVISGEDISEAFVTVTIYPQDSVPGLLAAFFDFSGSTITSLPETSSVAPDWGHVVPGIEVPQTSGLFNGTPFDHDVAIRYTGIINIATPGEYSFFLASADGSRLIVDGVPIIQHDGLHVYSELGNNTTLTAGRHEILVEYFIGTANGGITFDWMPPSESRQSIPHSVFMHNVAGLAPVINTINPFFGLPAGGDTVTISGYGFFGAPVVLFGSNPGTNIKVTSLSNMKARAPAGENIVNLTIETTNGFSDPAQYSYDESAFPAIQWNSVQEIHGILDPTVIVFGPDERLYVATDLGIIEALTLDENNNVISVETITSIADLGTHETIFGVPLNRAILGMAFNPLDNQSDPAIYLSHSPLFSLDAYPSKVSVLRKSNNWAIQDLITGLPTSAHDHAVNGLEFGDDGKLYILVGGNTDLGVPHSSFNDKDETPLSAALLVADITNPNFNGAITYNQIADLRTSKQVSGDVFVYSSGLRNAFDLALHTNGFIYGTDNGPGGANGVTSIDCNTNGTELPDTPTDTLNRYVEGAYYGHPNRNRGDDGDSRQCTYYNDSSPNNPPTLTAQIADVPSSTNGIFEYRSNTFGGQLRGDLILGKLRGQVRRISLAPNTITVTRSEELHWKGGLDVTEGFDGSVFIARHPSGVPDDPENNVIGMLVPIEASAQKRITSVFPKRGPHDGSRSLLISGIDFSQSLQDTWVTVGDSTCTVTSVTATRIRCDLQIGSAGLKDVTVFNGGDILVLTDGYQFMTGSVNDLPSLPQPPINYEWVIRAPLPHGLFETATGVVDSRIYLWGGRQNLTQIYNPFNDSWSFGTPIPAGDDTGEHFHAEAIGSKIYLIGSIDPELSVLRIYDTTTNSWSIGAPIMSGGEEYVMGSVQSAVHDGKLYVLGGIHWANDSNKAMVYDPTTNSWSDLAPLPIGISHAAVGIHDGKIYLFAGHRGPNFPAGELLGTVQIYDILSNTWSIGPAPVPTLRSGMGRAPFINGEFLIIGGEQPVTFATFETVEAYNPITHSWRTAPSMPGMRHAFQAAVIGDEVHVIGGSATFGFTESVLHFVYNPADYSINNPPTVENIAPVTINEGELVQIFVVASDEDSDPLTITYGPPLNGSGAWKTNYFDAGVYNVSVSVSDGTNVVEKFVIITVNNVPIVGGFDPYFMYIDGVPYTGQPVIGSVNVTIRNDNTTLISLIHDFISGTIIFDGFSIKTQGDNDSRGYTIVSGLNLTSGKKTVFVSVIQNTGYVCVRDAPTVNVSEISEACATNQETIVKCDNSNVNGFVCTIENGTYQISGLHYSGVRETNAPPPPSPPPSGGGGGGGGSSSGAFTAPPLQNTPIVNISEPKITPPPPAPVNETVEQIPIVPLVVNETIEDIPAITGLATADANLRPGIKTVFGVIGIVALLGVLAIAGYRMFKKQGKK